MRPRRAVIAGGGAITAVGLGMEALTRAVRANASGLRPCPRFAGRGYQTDVAGWVPEDARAQFGELDPTRRDAWAFRFAEAALREAVRECEAAGAGNPGSPRASGPALATIPADRRALVLATTKAEIATLEDVLRGPPGSAAAQRHLFPALLATDLAAAHGVTGCVRSVSVACVSGLLALQQGALLIEEDRADAVFVVGVDLLSHFVLSGFTTLKSLDPAGCRPFDATRQGLSLGEGAGAVVLTCQAAGPSPALAVAGWGSSNDANHLTGPSRDGSGLALALERALRRAGATPEGVDFVHAHGTGTPYNDAMEGMALRSVFGSRVPPFCSSKGLLGHTLGAAGLLETLVCRIAAREQLLPGTPGLRTPDPALPESVLTEPRPAHSVRRLVKLNAGFGGTNAALVLEWRDA